MRRAVLAVVLLLALGGCLEGTSNGLEDPEPSSGGAADDAEDDADDEDDPDAETEPIANGTIEVHAIDVGQADATLVIGPENETMLIDSGDWRNDGETVLAYLDEYGVDRIDYLVTTHPHADHIGGHAAVIEHYETEREGIGEIYDPGVAHTTQTYERYLDAVEAHDVTLFDAQEGDEIPMEGVDARIVNPPADPGTDDLHYNSLAVHLAFGDAAFLLTGDAETGAEERMTATHDLNATVYQAGHHGSSTSSTDGFLEAVAPEMTIVSSNYDSQYGHPHNETLDRFADHGVDVYWTGIHGTIVVETDGNCVTVSTAVDAPIHPDSVTDAPAADAPATAAVEERRTYCVAADCEDDEEAAVSAASEPGPPIDAPSPSVPGATAGGVP